MWENLDVIKSAQSLAEVECFLAQQRLAVAEEKARIQKEKKHRDKLAAERQLQRNQDRREMLARIKAKKEKTKKKMADARNKKRKRERELAVRVKQEALTHQRKVRSFITT